jgi:hypothetical protein
MTFMNSASFPHLQGSVAAAQVVQAPHKQELLLSPTQHTRLHVTQVELKVNCSGAQHSTAQHSTAQHSTAQHSKRARYLQMARLNIT